MNSTVAAANAALDRQRADGVATVQRILEAGREQDATWVAENLFVNAEAARKGSFFAGAVPMFEAAIEHFTALNRRDEVSACHCNLGLCLKNLSRHRDAIGHLETSADIDRQTGNEVGLSMTLTNIGLCYDALSQYDLAITYYQQSLDIDTRRQDLAGIAFTQNNLGMTLSTKGDYDRAVPALETAVASYEKLGLHANLPNPLINLGNVLNRKGAHQQAFGIFERVRALVQQQPLLTAKAYNGIGSALMGLGELRAAIAYYHAALDIYRQLGHSEGLSRSLGMLADALYSFGDLEQAAAYYADKEQLDRDSDNVHGVAIALHGQAKIMSKARDFEAAITLYEQAHAMNLSISDLDFDQTICLNLATTYFEKKQTRAARLLYQRARRINRTVKSDTTAMLYHSGMSNLELLEERLRSARWHARAALRLARQMGAVRTQILALKNLSVGWLQPATLHLAYRYGQQAIALAEQHLATVFDEAFSLAHQSDFSDLYAYMAVLSYERERPRMSFKIMEMAKARVLNRQMALRARLSPTVQQREVEYLYRQERHWSDQLLQWQTRQHREGFTADNMRDLNHCSDQLKAVLHHLKTADPAYYAARTGAPLDFTAIQRLLE